MGRPLHPEARKRTYAEIRRLYAEGRIWRDIVGLTGVSEATVGTALKGHTVNRYNRGPGLSPHDHAEIERLADRGWGPSAVAAHIGRNPSTVHWYMCSRGLGTFGTATKASSHGGRPFTPEEDAFVVERRLKGHSFQEIGGMVRDRFGWDRHPNSVRYRVMMLATQDEEAA